jgi:hypothetical protein
MRRLVIAVAAMVALGCGSADDFVPTLPVTSTDVVGDFVLRTANGNELPFVAFTTTTGDAWELASDKMFLKSDGQWSESTLYVVHKLSDGSSNSNETVVSGTYTIANGQINFVMTQGGTEKFAGSVIGTELRLLFNGRLFVYTK